MYYEKQLKFIINLDLLRLGTILGTKNRPELTPWPLA